MLSYQHIFHAGNHADILKHITITLILTYLTQKDKPITVYDTHAGAGLYSLNDERALKTGEFSEGIKKLITVINQNKLNNEVQKLISPYLKIVKNYYSNNFYPGSPFFELNLLRKNDEIILSELHPQVINELKKNIKTELSNLHTNHNDNIPNVNIHFRNGIEMLKALTPPKTKRGCAIIDPSFEDKSDYDDVANLICDIYKKWSNGTLVLWYPLIERRSYEIDLMKNKIKDLVNQSSLEDKTIDIQLEIKNPAEMTGLANLYGSGMFVVNPPYELKSQMALITTSLKELLI
ncbi:MAG: 23S rRNA (adenine(2030)-N(6))-methyltransferase RlmJ [Treponema sp.]|nr:23S rRNA (adenine(2030)-N(6))-methyltransferase RlmJ [Treponema sp.]